MPRYFIHLAYDGTAYHGWQIQPNGISVQEALQKALTTILRTPIEVVGAGRTDAGVHAKLMVAHFETPSELDCHQTAYKLNRLLPPDISIYKILPVKEDAHARFDATQRTYHYFIHTEKSPFHRHYSCRLHAHLDYDLMNEAGRILCTYTDFTSFSKLHTDVKTNLCTVTKAEFSQIDETAWRFEISANRFLRNMVRAVVGTLVDVGRGKLSLADFRAVIEGKNRSSAGESMPGNALFLVGIEYPEETYLAQ